jgi:hypothetical protein
LQEQLKLLTERKYELAAAEEAAKASPEEQREALMARVKRDNAAVERATREAKQLQEEVRQLEAAVAAAGSAVAGGGGMKSGGALLPPDTDKQGRRCGLWCEPTGQLQERTYCQATSAPFACVDAVCMLLAGAALQANECEVLASGHYVRHVLYPAMVPALQGEV